MTELTSRKTPGRNQDLRDAKSSRVPVEKIRALRRVKSTRLALRFLLPTDDADQRDAEDGLIRCCMKVLKGRGAYLVGRDSAQVVGLNAWHRDCQQETRCFVWLSLRHILEPYRGRPRRHSIMAALKDRFRYLPRTVYLKVCDERRRLTRERIRGFCTPDAAFRWLQGDWSDFDSRNFFMDSPESLGLILQGDTALEEADLKIRLKGCRHIKPHSVE